MNWRISGYLVIGILVVGVGACGEDDVPSEDQAAYELEDEGAICFGTAHPAEPETGVKPGTSTPLVLYVDKTMVPDAEGGFAGECDVTIDGDEIIVDNGIFVPNEDSSYFDEAASPYTVECSELTLEEKSYTVRMGETIYELDLSQAEDDGVTSRTTCLGLGEEIVEENTAELCVRPVEDEDANVEFIAEHEFGSTSCIDGYELQCDVHEDDGNYSVMMVATYRRYSEQISDGECTADLAYRDVDCAALDLEEGSYEFSYGDEVLAFDVPVEDDVCVH